jgi:hypothetical protein
MVADRPSRPPVDRRASAVQYTREP